MVIDQVEIRVYRQDDGMFVAYVEVVPALGKPRRGKRCGATWRDAVDRALRAVEKTEDETPVAETTPPGGA